jgi:hypothetical protein
MTETIGQIDAIDGRAFEMARTVLRDPGRRAELLPEAEQLSDRLDGLNDRLAREDPARHDERTLQISEATLDLLFVRMDTGTFSLRINRLRRPV